MIIVTGSSGYLGSHVVSSLKNSGINHTVLKYSPDYRHDIKEIFASEKIQGVIHTATNYGDANSLAHDLYEDNVEYPVSIMRSGISHGLQFFINIDTALPPSVNAYAKSKSVFIEHALEFSEISFYNIRMQHFYGPYNRRKNFITRIIQDMINEESQIDLTEGNQQRDFFYISDAVSAIIRILDYAKSYHAARFENFHVGYGSSISIRDVVEMIQRLCCNEKTKLNYGSISRRRNEPEILLANLEKISDLGWKPETSLKSGLMKTIQSERLRISSSADSHKESNS